MPHDPRISSSRKYIIVRIKEPVLWNRTDKEAWLLNPPNRYILNADQVGTLTPYIDTISELDTASLQTKLNGLENLAGRKILVERYRDRGIGDLLFTTGPLSYLKHIHGSDLKIYYYTLAERGHVLHGNPILASSTTLSGPIIYDSLSVYDRHWFIESATEYDEEQDQSNVYDCLFKQIGLNPDIIQATYKRPSMTLLPDDFEKLDVFYYRIFCDRQVDLRKTEYIVLSPTCNSNLRAAKFSMWLDLIQQLSERFPVIVAGAIPNSSFTVDMPVTDFYTSVAELSSHNRNIINMLGTTPVRLAAALIYKAKALVSLDSGLLYVAQALRVPAVSLWGTHNPSVRLGYDSSYMDLAIHRTEYCSNSPCFAYSKFPKDKCPSKTEQSICSPLQYIQTSDVLEKLKTIFR